MRGPGAVVLGQQITPELGGPGVMQPIVVVSPQPLAAVDPATTVQATPAPSTSAPTIIPAPVVTPVSVPIVTSTPGASQVATDSQATGAGFPSAGELASNEDLQVLVPSGSGYAYQDVGQIPQSVLSSLGINLSDAQNLSNAQTVAILNAMAAAVAGTTTAAVAAVSPCSFALFGDQTCIGPIGTTTALVLGGVAVALLFMFGGKK
jgi:hypothetical protein